MVQLLTLTTVKHILVSCVVCNTFSWSHHPSNWVQLPLSGVWIWTFKDHVKSSCGPSNSITHSLPERCRSSQKRSYFSVLISMPQKVCDKSFFLLEVVWYEVGFCHHSYMFVMFSSCKSNCIQKWHLQASLWRAQTCYASVTTLNVQLLFLISSFSILFSMCLVERFQFLEVALQCHDLDLEVPVLNRCQLVRFYIWGVFVKHKLKPYMPVS